eukprot:COSAG05_NODE_401_length_10253_cov_23.087453_5_plen_82_part_00
MSIPAQICVIDVLCLPVLVLVLTLGFVADIYGVWTLPVLLQALHCVLPQLNTTAQESSGTENQQQPTKEENEEKDACPKAP